METFVGLLRDALAAGLALAVMFDLAISEKQIVGILVFFTTLAAVATWGIKAYNASHP